MKITDVIPVLLICQHIASVCGAHPLFPPYNHPLSLIPQQPFDQNLEQLTLQRADQLLRHQFLLLQKLNPSQQQFPPFQSTNLPELQPQPRFQLPVQQQFQQQFQQPQQQLYSPFQQPDPLLQQSTQNFYLPIICPQGTPMCADGQIATCARHAVTGSIVYNCLNPISRNMVPGTPDTPVITPSSSENTTFNDANPLDSKTGARSLLLERFSVFDAVPEPLPTYNTTDQRLRFYADSEAGKQWPNVPLPNGPYPCDNRLCRICSLLMIPFSLYSICNQGQLGYPNVSNFRSPLSQPGYLQQETLSNFYSATLPFGSPTMLKPENVAYPYQLPSGFPPEPYNKPGFLLPSHYSLGQGSYPSPRQFFANQQPLSPYSPPLSPWPVNKEPKQQDHKQQFALPSYPNNPGNQPIRNAPETYQNLQPLLRQMPYNPAYKRMAPLQPAMNPLVFPDTESRQPERIIESPWNQPPLTMSLVSNIKLPLQNYPTFQGPQPPPPQNPRQKQLFAKSQGTLLYQSQGLQPPMRVRGVQGPLQPRYQGMNQLPQQFQPSPLGLSIPQQHPWGVKMYENAMQRKYFPGANIPEKFPQKPQYLTSGLSLLSEHEEPLSQEKPLTIDDKLISSKQHVKKKKVQKPSNRTPKPNSSGFWF